MIDNQWPGIVSDQTISYLERAIARKICSQVRHPWLPTEGAHYVAEKTINSKGVAIYKFKELIGLDTSRSTRRNEADDVDVFWFDIFLGLEDLERLAILSYVDPFDESGNEDEWNAFVERHFKQERYGKVLRRGMVRMQGLAEERGLVKSMQGILKGWYNISQFLGWSVPTTMKRAVELRMPIIRLGGEVETTEEELTNWRKNLYTDERLTYWRTKKTKRSSKSNNN